MQYIIHYKTNWDVATNNPSKTMSVSGTDLEWKLSQLQSYGWKYTVERVNDD
jgi:hypothetical protein